MSKKLGVVAVVFKCYKTCLLLRKSAITMASRQGHVVYGAAVNMVYPFKSLVPALKSAKGTCGRSMVARRDISFVALAGFWANSVANSSPANSSETCSRVVLELASLPCPSLLDTACLCLPTSWHASWFPSLYSKRCLPCLVSKFGQLNTWHSYANCIHLKSTHKAFGCLVRPLGLSFENEIWRLSPLEMRNPCKVWDVESPGNESLWIPHSFTSKGWCCQDCPCASLQITFSGYPRCQHILAT